MTPDSTEAVMGTPTFSILTGVYNNASTVGDTVASVLAQDRSDWEMIVVNDGSSDDSVAVVERVAAGDPRIRIISKENGGVSSARNAGAALARGEFLCVLDADDCYTPGYLSAMHELITRYPDRDLYSCNGTFVFPSGFRTPVRKSLFFRTEREFTLDEMLKGNQVFIMAVMRRTAYDRVGGFRGWMVEDYDLWMRILITGGRHIYTPSFLGLYRVTPGSLSKSFDLIQKEQLATLKRLAGEFPDVMSGPAFEAAVVAQEQRMEFAIVEKRIVQGDFRGARRAFFVAWSAHRTRIRKWLGATTMLVSPALYKTVFLRNMYPEPPNNSGRIA